MCSSQFILKTVTVLMTILGITYEENQLYEHADGGWIFRFIGPILNVTEKYLEVSRNTSLHLKCAGQFPLAWQLEDPGATAVLNLEASAEGHIGPTYESTIHLEFNTSRDTGRYRCLFRNTTKSENSDSIFVSVDGSSCAVEAPAPILNVTQKYMDVPLNTTLYLKCCGRYPLLWKFHSLMTQEVISLRPVSETVPVSPGRDVFESIIRLEFHDPAYTGRYSCDFNSTTNKESSSFYVSVYDSLSAAQIGTPTLNVSDKSMDVSPNTSQYLKCIGYYPLDWEFQNPKTKEIRRFETPSKKVNDTSGRHRFENVLRLEFKTYRDTGRYSCVFKNTLHEKSASLYFFVNDLERLLLPINGFPFEVIDVTDGQPVTVPCLPTNSVSNVSFWISSANPETVLTRKVKSRESLCDKEFVLTDGVSYDATQGLTIARSTKDFLGPFCCKAEMEEHNQTIAFMFVVRREVKWKFKPYLDTREAEFVVLDSSFSLPCKSRLNLSLTWSFPVGANKRMTIDGKSQTDGETSTLTIHSAQKDDEGLYRCSVIYESYNMVYKEVFVHIYKSKELPFVKSEGDTMEFKSNHNAFPFAVDAYLKKDGLTIRLSEKYEVLLEKDAAILRVHNLLRNDNGAYHLYRGGYHFTSDMFSQLRIKDKPKITVYYEDRRNEYYELHCRVQGLPLPDTKWIWKPMCKATTPCDIGMNFEVEYEEGKYFPNALNSTQRSLQEDDTVILSLLLKKQEPGQYFCRGINEMGTTEEKLLSIAGERQPLFVREYDVLSLICVADKSLYKNIEIKSTVSLKNDVISYQSQYSMTKKLTADITTSHDFYTTCSASYEDYTLGAKKITVEMFVIFLRAPKITSTNINLMEMEAVLNGQLYLFCFVTELPRTKVTWYRDKIPLRDYEKTVVQLSDNFQNMVISHLAKEDGGLYECRAENKAGVVSRNTTVVVLTAPMIFSTNINTSRLETNAGERLELYCYVDGTPVPTVTWKYNNEPLDSDTPGVILSERYQKLEITKLVKTNAGLYECRAENKVGFTYRTTFLSIKAVPHIYRTNMNSSRMVAKTKDHLELYCYADGAPQPKVTWYRNNETLSAKPPRVIIYQSSHRLLITQLVEEDSGHYECTAENVIGVASRNISLTVDT